MSLKKLKLNVILIYYIPFRTDYSPRRLLNALFKR